MASPQCTLRVMQQLAWAYLDQMATGDPLRGSLAAGAFAAGYNVHGSGTSSFFGSAASSMPARLNPYWDATTRTMVIAFLAPAFGAGTPAFSAIRAIPETAGAAIPYIRDRVLPLVEHMAAIRDFAEAATRATTSRVAIVLATLTREDITNNCAAPEVPAGAPPAVTPPAPTAPAGAPATTPAPITTSRGNQNRGTTASGGGAPASSGGGSGTMVFVGIAALGLAAYAMRG